MGILVVDAVGTIFNALVALDLDVPLRRLTGLADPAEGDDLAIIASYGQTNWDVAAQVARRVNTVIVVADPIGDDAARAIAIGALGYLDLELSSAALRRSIVGALAGEHAFSRRVLSLLLREGRWTQGSSLTRLTPRQRQVMELIASGAPDKEIARSLGITTATAQKHVTNLLRRLNVSNRAAAVAATSSRVLT